MCFLSRKVTLYTSVNSVQVFHEEGNSAGAEVRSAPVERRPEDYSASVARYLALPPKNYALKITLIQTHTQSPYNSCKERGKKLHLQKLQ